MLKMIFNYNQNNGFYKFNKKIFQMKIFNSKLRKNLKIF